MDWPHLKNAPIVEGLIDIQVEPLPSGSLAALKACADELAADFPSREQLRMFMSQFSFTPDAGPSVTAQAPASTGMMLRSADNRWVAQFRINGFTLSRLEPYTTWAELNARARGLWGKYSSAIGPQKIVRVATRYVNRIPVAMGESFEKTFTTTFTVAASLPQAVASFLLRIVIPFEKEKAVAIVTQHLPESGQECIFDLDAFSIDPEGFTETEAWAKLEELRGLKNRLFFESLTRGAVERFK